MILLLYLSWLVILSLGIIKIDIIGKILIIDIFIDDMNKLFIFIFKIGSKLSNFISPINDKLLRINMIKLIVIKIILIWEITFISLVEQYTDKVTNKMDVMIIGVR